MYVFLECMQICQILCSKRDKGMAEEKQTTKNGCVMLLDIMDGFIMFDMCRNLTDDQQIDLTFATSFEDAM